MLNLTPSGNSPPSPTLSPVSCPPFPLIQANYFILSPFQDISLIPKIFFLQSRKLKRHSPEIVFTIECHHEMNILCVYIFGELSVLASPLRMSSILYRIFERCLDSNPESCRSKQAR